jgi:hypothetical protein
MATKYDPSVIQQFADRLYAQAARIVLVYAVFGFTGGAVGGGILTNAALDSFLIGAVFGGGLLGALFAVAAQTRAFALRLQAQTALCQVQIEMNTRDVPMRGGVAA